LKKGLGQFFTGLICLMVYLNCAGDKTTGVGETPNPSIPANPFPPDRSLEQDTYPLTSDLYMGTGINMPLVDSNISANNYHLGSLEYNTTYLWKIVAEDTRGNQFDGHVWSFTTRRQPGIYLAADYNALYPGGLLFVTDGYAYLMEDRSADYRSILTLVDLNDPTEPTMAGIYDSERFIRGIFVRGNLGFILGYPGFLQILDLTIPSNPVLISESEWQSILRDIFIASDYAYISGYHRLRIVDISDVTNPLLVAAYITEGQTNAIFVADEYAYVTANGQGLLILDVSDPYDPVLAGTYNFQESISNICVQGNYAYLSIQWGGGLIIDVSDTSNPLLAGSYDDVQYLFVHGTFAYGESDGNLVMFDISDPTVLMEIARFQMVGNVNKIVADDDYIYVIDSDIGLLILEYLP
jgi:hypothetical protein